MTEFYKKVRQSFENQLDGKIEPIQQDVWEALDNELFHTNHSKGASRKMKKKTRTLSLVLVSAAALFLVFLFTTKPGSALITQIKDIFAPEKKVTQSIEGQEEDIDVTLQEGTNVDYILYIDESRYKMVKGEDVDIVTTIEPLPDRYPPVSLEIKQIPDQSPEEVVRELETTIKENFSEVEPVEEVTDPVKGYLIHGIDGSESTSKVIHTYVVSNGKEGSFILEGNYFLEAAEGHGARFHHMLKSFEVIEK